MVLGFYWNFAVTFERYCERYCGMILHGPLAFPLLVILFTICVVFPSLPWILYYGYVIIPNEPYVKFCKDGQDGAGVGHRVRAFLSNETETWECPPKPGSTWVKQSIHKDWQCNETYCTADELASPESCFSATVSTTYNADQDVQEMRRRFCYNWSEDNPGCCADYTEIGSTLLRCEYCIPDKEVLWAISTFAGIATFIACIFLLGPFMDMLVDSSEVWGHEVEKAKKEAEEKAKKDAEAAEHGV